MLQISKKRVLDETCNGVGKGDPLGIMQEIKIWPDELEAHKIILRNKRIA